MVKTAEQIIKEGRILKETKRNIKLQRSNARKEAIKNFAKKRYEEIKKYKLPKKRSSAFKKATNAYGYRKSLSSNLMRTFGGATGGVRISSGSQQQGKRPVGRPRGEFKHRDPQTGQPIPATVYYKRIKELKRMAQQQAQQRDLQAIQALAKRGIPPEQAKQIVDQQQLQSVGVQPQQFQQIQQTKFQNPYNQPNNIPQGMPVGPQNQTIWRGRRGVVGKDAGLFGAREVVYGLPESFWN